MDQFTANLAAGIRRFAMAGVGAITLTVDKSKEIIEQLAQRGEVSAAEGQAACDELHKRLTEQVSSFTQKLRTEYENLSFEQMLSRCQKLTPEQKQQLIDRLTAQPEEAEANTDAAEESAEAAASAPAEESEASDTSTEEPDASVLPLSGPDEET